MPKSSFLLIFFRFLVKFGQQHMGSNGVKLATKCYKTEWDEKGYYTSDILFE